MLAAVFGGAGILLYLLAITKVPRIVKKLNHLNNTERYEIDDNRRWRLAIDPQIVDDRNCLYFSVFFLFTKKGFAAGLSMVKINIDGEELAIRINNSASSTTATTMTSGAFIGNVLATSSATYYTTDEGASITLNKEQYLFLSKLPTCKEARIDFIGAAGDINKTRHITGYNKRCMGCMIEQSKILMKQGKKIEFSEKF